MLDKLIINGEYPDFEKGVLVKANIGIKGGKIAYIGAETPDAAEVIDAAGKVVSPGFIDIHMHEENFAKEGKEYIVSRMMLEMGVTTVVGGNCGVQYQPLADFKAVIKELGGCPVNYIMLAGYNELRTKMGIGRYQHPSQKQMDELREQLKGELAEGAYGISFGIEYDPGITFDEMLSAAKATDNPHHFLAAHYRDETKKDDLFNIEELIRFAEMIPQRFQISHLSSCSATGSMKEALECINAAMEKNPRLNYDTYPYNAFSTHIGSAVFEDGCLEGWGKDYSDILLTDEPYKNVYCTKEIFEDARANYPKMLAVAAVMNEDEIRAAIVNKNGMVASDAIINSGSGHPRAAGTFPRVLGKYVRQEKALPLVDAIRKMSLEPAMRLELEGKGKIAVGCDADITIFDPETIIDKADFTHLEKPEGIEYVIVGGKYGVKSGQTVSLTCGKFLPFDK
jgi:N-acyl-D-amino-acid deacylase